jgi:hypothetical protein
MKKGQGFSIFEIKATQTLMTVNLEQLGSGHRSFRGIWALSDPQFKTEFTAPAITL